LMYRVGRRFTIIAREGPDRILICDNRESV